jgi:GNAT superfamily N-acetyltransferase
MTNPPFRKPEIAVEIEPVKPEAWRIFREHHYLDHNLNKAAHCYVGYWNDEPVTFVGVLHFPHRKTNKFKRVTRFVTLPAYQGLGIGTQVLDSVCQSYRQRKHRITIATSHPALMYKLNKKRTWRCIDSFGRNAAHQGDSKKKSMNKTSSDKRKTATFEYDGGTK